MDKELIKIIKSGDFSIYYHDNGCGTIYKGRHDFDKIDWEKDDEKMEELIIFESDLDGYYTGDVALLVKALGGVLYSV